MRHSQQRMWLNDYTSIRVKSTAPPALTSVGPLSKAVCTSLQTQPSAQGRPLKLLLPHSESAQSFNISIDYTPYKFAIKHASYSLCQMLHLELSYFLTRGPSLIIPFSHFAPSFVLSIWESISISVYLFICFIFWIQHISENIWYLAFSV